MHSSAFVSLRVSYYYQDSALKNTYLRKKSKFTNFRPSSWFRHLDLEKSDDGFVISALKNAYVRILTKKRRNLGIFVRHLGSTIFDLKSWRIRNQRSWKPLYATFPKKTEFGNFRPPSWIRHVEFEKSDDGFVISALANAYILILTKKSWTSGISVRHLGFTICIFKSWRIRNQLLWKPLYANYKKKTWNPKSLVRHLEFGKSDDGFVMSALENAYMPIFTKKM